MPPMTSDDVLETLRETGALLRGHFELRSGLHSPEFFQCANLLRWPRKAEALCSALAALLPTLCGMALCMTVTAAARLFGLV